MLCDRYNYNLYVRKLSIGSLGSFFKVIWLLVYKVVNLEGLVIGDCVFNSREYWFLGGWEYNLIKMMKINNIYRYRE